jgi:prevent-host-death family protein
MTWIVSLYNAKTHLSALLEQAAASGEIVIAKDGVPQARLVPLAFHGQPRKSANAVQISHIADDFDAPDAVNVTLLEGSE